MDVLSLLWIVLWCVASISLLVACMLDKLDWWFYPIGGAVTMLYLAEHFVG